MIAYAALRCITQERAPGSQPPYTDLAQRGWSFCVTTEMVILDRERLYDPATLDTLTSELDLLEHHHRAVTDNCRERLFRPTPFDLMRAALMPETLEEWALSIGVTIAAAVLTGGTSEAETRPPTILRANTSTTNATYTKRAHVATYLKSATQS